MLKDLFYKKRHRYATVAQTDRRPKPEIPDEVPPRDVPKGLVEKCKGCGALLMARELQKHAYTCPHCDYHFPIGGPERLQLLLDDGSFEEFDAALSSEDPLGFPGYREKVEKAKQATNLAEGVVTGAGRIDGQALVVGVMDARFIMGSMGSAVGEKLTRAMEAALARQCPMVLFTASGGARMQEGILSLMQMAKTSAAVNRMHEAGILYVSVITHPTTGGVSASFASIGDIILAEPGALFGFAGRRVIEQTIRQKLPDDFQTAEFMLQHGMIDKVVHRKQMRDTLSAILRIHAARGWQDAGATGV
ncbi:acetyl-CoA carboxylase, carboxyltransferase subunit beta [Alicyclobacillus kakegawensis]|uniref:acetyl-CoA carboxylase, carboxyltransferase subunit beta n=1 Tax=Alicyclobacillus kakegawensis TaxID=392012 RepID=UPI0008330168|nr:acetyl-CoA carboxylase, carboxyltransferase subunit beta [Alicyclobacillus kakegawensis]